MQTPLRIFRRADPAAAGNGVLVLQSEDGWFDLSSHVGTDDLRAPLAAEVLTGPVLRGLVTRGELGVAAAPEADEALLPPLLPDEVGKILALGKNFAAHAAEFGEAVPQEPLFFNKLPETLCGHGTTVEVPAWFDGRFDHEAELAVVIGRAGKLIAAADAMEHVAGYSVANDLTARTLQQGDREKKFPWFRGKNLDQCCPLGPCFVPRDELDVADLRVTCEVNGELQQDSTTALMVVDIPSALEWLSRHLTLRPGDLVLMGTPAGVGPLEDGDEVVCAVAGIGRLGVRVRRGC